MSASVKVEGLDEILRELSALGVEAVEIAGNVVEMMGQKSRTAAIKRVQKPPKTGRVYKRGKGRNLSPTHQASAPGQSPATDTGTLASSIQFVRSGINGFLFSRLKYAPWLEYGTQNMEPRPFMHPSVNENREWFAKKLKSELLKAAKEFNQK